MDTKFKSELVKKLHDKGLTQNSIHVYIRNLEKLNDDKPLLNLSFLKNIDTIDDKLKKYKDNTRRNYLISICSALNVLDNDNSKKMYNKYFTKMMDYNKALKSDEKKRELSNTQRDYWIESTEIDKVRDSLKFQVQKFENHKKIDPKEYTILLHYVILCLYTLFPPRRNKDYQCMNACRGIKKSELSKNINWLDMDDEKFIFNVYKTVRTEGEQEFNIPKELMDVIHVYIKFHPCITNKKKYNVPFLVWNNGEPLKNVNDITLILNKIFKSLNKKISTSALRHMYVTHKYGDEVNEREKDAQIMAHSLQTQNDTYIKKIK